MSSQPRVYGGKRKETFDYSKVDLPEGGLQRFLTCAGRSALRHCPYCGGAHIFKNWFSLKDRCPTCNVLYEYEDGYSVGAYAINLIITEFIAVGVTLSLLIWSDLSTLALQLTGASLAIGLPIFFYPYAVLLFICLDLTFHHPRDFSERPRV
ncbi:MAG: hypothetical protein WBA46_06180 [Thermomicrobiales bacterium]